MSVRASMASPRACSGDMYFTVPTTAPAADVSVVRVGSASLIAVRGRIFASPKSRILTRPSGRTITFSGLTSR